MFIMIGVLLLVGGNGQPAEASHSSNSKHKQPTPTPTAEQTPMPTPTPQTGGDARPLSAVAPSVQHVIVSFDQAPDGAATTAGNYSIVNGRNGRNSLPILAVARVGTTNDVVITTAPQDAVEYTLQYPPNAKRKDWIEFAGSVVPEPRLVGADQVDESQVLLTFSEAMGESAENAVLYQVMTAETPPVSLSVISAALTDDPAKVLLTTEPLEPETDYLVEVGQVQSEGGLYLDPTQNIAGFTGEDFKPRLLGAEPQGEDGVLLTFSRPLAASAADPALYTATPDHLVVHSASLTNGDTQVLLGTSTHYAIEYTIVASGVTDANGTPLPPEGDSATFTGLRPISAERPKVVGAISTGNTGVRVSFSKPMADNAEDPGRYAIVQENVNPEVGALGVVAAEFADEDRLSVLLTTRSQNEVTYKVTVSTTTDIFGNPMADRVVEQGVLVDPTSFSFPGTPPTGDQHVDTDGDGLSDDEEAFGWVVTIRLADGGTTTRQVTGSPDSADSDGDGLNDFTEKGLGIDPRDSDTDDDGLTDFVEFNETFSDPLAQDTDADTVTDGLEFTFFRSSPILADTDGDKFLDADEIFLETRNPRAGDLPEPTLEIGEMRMDLDVRFTQVISEEVVEVDSRTETATLAQSESQELANSHSTTIETSFKFAHSSEIAVSSEFPKIGAVFTNTFSQEFSGGASYTGTWSEASTQATQETYEDSLTTTEQVSESKSVTREVVGAQMQLAVTLKNAGDVAFTIRNIQVSALVQDPRNPERLTPIATLLPVEPDTGFNLGPLSPERGPIIFANNEMIPQVVEALMKDPRGVVFRFANYDLLAEDGRNFAFTSQDINDRTAGLVIDFGGADTDGDGQGDFSEIERVATGTGRRVDTNGDGTIDDDDRNIVFDGQGQQVGITLRDALQALGLTEYDETETPTTSLTLAQLEGSYSVERSGESERIFRVRTTALDPTLAQRWFIITPTGIGDDNVTLDDVIVNAGETHTIAFLQDVDGDRLPATWEFLNRCSDQNIDTDGDELDDRFELVIGWDAATERSIRRVFSSCSSADTDRDGLTDLEEAPGIVTRDADGRVLFDPANEPRRDTSGVSNPNDLVEVSLADPITDPSDRDTDDDELQDKFELDGFTVTLRSPPAPPNTTVFVVTSPEFFDTDGDSASDGLEKRLGGNPRDAGDANTFEDIDGDGLVNAQEEDGWDVTWYGPSLPAPLCDEVCPEGASLTNRRFSDPLNPDTDGDGLSDAQELLLITSPEHPDTDFDGLSDDQEAFGLETQDFGFLFTDPLDADTDDDKRLDGSEIAEGLIVRVAGQAPYKIFSNPTDPDQDFDRLVDGDEKDTGTDPAKHDSDGDTRSDYDERVGTTRPTVPDLIVTVELGHVNVKSDCDGPNAGDWHFTFDVMRPDGGVTHLATNPDKAGYPTRRVLPMCVAPPRPDLTTQCYGDDGSGVAGRDVYVTSGDRIRLDGASTTFSVSTTSALPESFHIFGEVSEIDNNAPDSQNGFPWVIDIFSEPTTLVQGSEDLTPGIRTLEIPFPSNEAGDCELSFRAVYHVR